LESHFDLWRKKNCVIASQRDINIQIHLDSYRGKLKYKYKLKYKLKKQTQKTNLPAVGITLKGPAAGGG